MVGGRLIDCLCHKECEHEPAIVKDSKVGARIYCSKCGKEIDTNQREGLKVGDAFRKEAANQKWEDRFLRTHYEPEHESGQTCWCEPRTLIKNSITHIEHNEQRVILKDFITETLASHRTALIEEVEKLRRHTIPYLRHYPVSEIVQESPENKAYNSAIDQIVALIKGRG